MFTSHTFQDGETMEFRNSDRFDALCMELEMRSNGAWHIRIDGDLKHRFSTFSSFKRKAMQLIDTHALRRVEACQW